jgi:hypothetical protein
MLGSKTRTPWRRLNANESVPGVAKFAFRAFLWVLLLLRKSGIIIH